MSCNKEGCRYCYWADLVNHFYLCTNDRSDNFNEIVDPHCCCQQFFDGSTPFPLLDNDSPKNSEQI